MEIKEKIQMKGHVNLKHFRQGKLIEERDDHNVIQTVGIEKMAKFLTAEYTGSILYMGIGLNTGAQGDLPAITLLDSEVNEGGTPAVVHRVLSSKSMTAPGVDTFVCTFNMTGSAAIKEVGLFDATPSGNMFARQQFAVLSLVNTDSLQVTWTITIVDT